jgi:hypothetical protein
MCNSRRVKLQCDGGSGDSGGSDEEVLRPRTAAEISTSNGGKLIENFYEA